MTGYGVEDDYLDEDRVVGVTRDGMGFIAPNSVHRLGPEALEHFAWLQRTAIEREMLEAKIEGAVKHAREFGLSWSAVGVALGLTGEGARQRYGELERRNARRARR